MGQSLLPNDAAPEETLSGEGGFHDVGWLSHGSACAEATGVRGAGMLAVVTDIGMMEPNERGELMLAAVHPGRSSEEARANTGWNLKIGVPLRTTEVVTELELGILRRELDPRGIYLKGG